MINSSTMGRTRTAPFLRLPVRRRRRGRRRSCPTSWPRRPDDRRAGAGRREGPAPADDPPLPKPAGCVPRDCALCSSTGRSTRYSSHRRDVPVDAAPSRTARGLGAGGGPNTVALAERIAGIAQMSATSMRAGGPGLSATARRFRDRRRAGGRRCRRSGDPTEYSNLLVLEIPATGNPAAHSRLYGAADAIRSRPNAPPP